MKLDNDIINSLPIAVFWKDLLGEYLGCNLRMVELLGYKSIKEIIGKKDQDLIWSQYSEQLKAGDECVMANKRAQTTQEQVVIKARKTTLLLTTRAPLKDAQGKVIGVIGTMLDLEDNHFTKFNMQLISQMVQNNKSLALQQIKHDIRSPLTGIIALGELISSGNIQDKDELHDLIKHLGQASSSLSKFLDSLSLICEKSFFDPESNSLVDLNALISNAVNLAKPTAILKNLTIQTNLDDGILVFSNEHKLFRIVAELLSNAIKYTESGEIKIIGKKVTNNALGSAAELQIIDTGFGMSGHNLDVLNQPKSLDSVQYTTLEKGNGFGLGMIKSTANILDIDLNAVKTDKGTEVRLYIKSNESELHK